VGSDRPGQKDHQAAAGVADPGQHLALGNARTVPNRRARSISAAVRIGNI
jgi:hypothetical protein